MGVACENRLLKAAIKIILLMLLFICELSVHYEASQLDGFIFQSLFNLFNFWNIQIELHLNPSTNPWGDDEVTLSLYIPLQLQLTA